jgi:CheY-like chemotaxis protein
MNKLQILLAEDNPALQNVIRFNLLSVGMEVQTASRGDDALKLFNNFNFDCLICDHQMPGMAGIDLIRTIRQGNHNPNIPAILCTSRVLDLDHNYLKNELRITAALGKPFSVRQIVSTVLQATRPSPEPVPV